VEVSASAQGDGQLDSSARLGQGCTVATSDAVGEDARIATCPHGVGSSQPKVLLAAVERGVLVTLLVNDAKVPVGEAQLAPVVRAVFAKLS
jgi:hypothetical protein